MSDKVRDAELAAAEFAVEGVGGAYVFHRTAENAADGRGRVVCGGRVEFDGSWLWWW